MVRGMYLGERRAGIVMSRFAAGAWASAALAAALVLSGCAPEPVVEPEPEPELLTISDAGGRYLDAVCPMNELWDAVDIEVDRLRIAAARGDGDASSSDTRLFVEAITALETKIVAAEELLGDETVEWPVGAKRAIAAVQSSLASDAGQAQVVSEMSAADIAAYKWMGVDALASASQEARAALGLPDDPRVACDLRTSPESAAE